MKRIIMLAMVLLVLVPTVLVGYAMNHYVKTTARTEKLDMLANTAHIIDTHLTAYYELLIEDMKHKAENEALRGFLLSFEPDGVRNNDCTLMRNLLLEPIGIPVFGGAVIDRDGRILVSASPDEEGLMRDKTELYSDIMSGSCSYIGLIMSGNNAEIFKIAVPVRDIQGETIGILEQNFSLDFLSAYLGSISLNETDKTFLIRENGSVIYDKGKENPASLYHDYQNNDSLEQLVSDLKSGRPGNYSGVIEYENQGIEYIGAYEKVDSINCFAVVAVPKEVLLGNYMKLHGIFLFITLLVLIAILIGGYLIGDVHIKSLRMMNDTLLKISNGDLAARCNYKGRHEFEELCRNVNNLADSYQKSERELRLSSRIDKLTHLPNQNAIYEVLDTLLYKHSNQALILLEIEGFKDTNDNLGYDIGDRILIEISDILRDLPLHVCYPSRLGGAEFLIFITNWTAQRYPEKIAEKILNRIEGIRFIDEIHVDISANIGIEYINEEKTDKKRLIKYANAAMHKARSVGRNSYFVHNPYHRKGQSRPINGNTNYQDLT